MGDIPGLALPFYKPVYVLCIVTGIGMHHRRNSAILIKSIGVNDSGSMFGLRQHVHEKFSSRPMPETTVRQLDTIAIEQRTSSGVFFPHSDAGLLPILFPVPALTLRLPTAHCFSRLRPVPGTANCWVHRVFRLWSVPDIAGC